MDKNVNISARIRNSDEVAFRSFYMQYKPLLLSFAINTLRNPFLAEDVVQDAFCRIWEKRNELNTDQPVQGFLYKMVYRRCVDYLRKQKSQSNYNHWVEIKLRELELNNMHLENLIVSGIAADELQVILQETLENMPEQTREIFWLSRNSGLKNADIAVKKGLSVKAVEYHISRALEQLRNVCKEFLKK